MREMQNIEYSYIIRELAQLEGKHFSKIYFLGENLYRLKIGDVHIIIQIPLRIGIAKYIVKSEEPTGFVEKIRKELNNQKLLKVYQCDKDRIVALEFEENTLFFEMFAKGNIILVDNGKTEINKSGKITELLSGGSWKNRTLARNTEYKKPESELIEDLEKTLSEKYLIVCLLKLPLGKEYVKDMLEKCGINEKKTGSELSMDEINCLKNEYNVIHEIQKPYLFLENGKPVDYGLVKFKKYENLEAKEMETLSEAMEEYYASISGPRKNEKMEKLERRLEGQFVMLEKLKTEEKEATEKGDFIYTNYPWVEEIHTIALKLGINNLGGALTKYKILKIDKEKKEIEVEL